MNGTNGTRLVVNYCGEKDEIMGDRPAFKLVPHAFSGHLLLYSRQTLFWTLINSMQRCCLDPGPMTAMPDDFGDHFIVYASAG